MNGIAVEESVILEEADRMREHLYRSMKGQPRAGIETKLRAWAVENAIERALLEQAIAAEPGDLSPEKGLERLIEQHGGRIGAPKMKEINEYYRRHRSEFVLPERVHVGHIMKSVDETTSEADALSALQGIEEEIRGGAGFEEVANRYKDDRGSAGDLGWISPGRLPVEFDNAVFALQPGTISPIFRTKHGFHIARVYEHEKERPATFEEARPTIERKLVAQKQQRAVERVVDYLRARAVIEE